MVMQKLSKESSLVRLGMFTGLMRSACKCLYVSGRGSLVSTHM